MITHREAEILISARQDAPLDTVVERELQAHLATCDDCRAFAIATERLTAGIKAMPSVPVNPRIRREVMGKVKSGRNPLARLFAGFGGIQSGPLLAGAAAIVIIGLLGWIALDRMVLDDNGDNENTQIAAVPTEKPVDLTLTSATQTEVPTATTPPEPTATTPPEPTATTPPEPTATTPPEPTATTPPEPTATTPPEPTATTPPEPTATTPPEPTATTPPEPTATTEADTGPVDLTTLSGESGTETPDEPTATTPPEPTATTPPEPTATTPPEPTATSEPEPTATAVPDPTDTPGIEPMDGQTVVDPDETPDAKRVSENGASTEVATSEADGTGDGEITSDEATAASTDEVDATGDGGNVPIEPIDGGTAEPTSETSSGSDDSDGNTIEASGDEEAPVESDAGSLIEPIGDGSQGATEIAEPQGGDEIVESTPEEGLGSGNAGESRESTSLVDASERYQGIAGDPSGDLGLTGEGRLEFMGVPDGASMTTSGGFRMQSADSQPGVVQLCGDGYCEPALEAPEDGGWQGDVPLGVVGETSYFLRLYGDRTEVISASSDGTAMYDTGVIGQLGPTSAPSVVYENEGILFAWLPTGEWLEVSSGGAEVYSGSYRDPSNVRFAPVASQGPLMGYFSGGNLVIAPISSPDSPVFSVPSDGVDFDMTPLADRVAVIRGNDIVIYDINGNELMVYEGGDLQPGSLIWLNGGIVFVDRNTGDLYQIPETAS